MSMQHKSEMSVHPSFIPQRSKGTTSLSCERVRERERVCGRPLTHKPPCRRVESAVENMVKRLPSRRLLEASSPLTGTGTDSAHRKRTEKSKRKTSDTRTVPYSARERVLLLLGLCSRFPRRCLRVYPSRIAASSNVQLFTLISGLRCVQGSMAESKMGMDVLKTAGTNLGTPGRNGME